MTTGGDYWLTADTGLKLDRLAISTYPLQPNPLVDLHNSKTGLYRMTSGIDRRIGLEKPRDENDKQERRDPTQSVHASVRDRWDKVPEYRPAELRAFFKRTGDPRADQP